jgi:hypothetical protein
MIGQAKTPGEIAWQLILADDPAEIARFEQIAGATQTEAVDRMIERSCWSVDVSAFVGGKGTPVERLAALRTAYADQERAL